MYLIQKLLGKDLGYRFRLLVKGPYSRKLMSDLRRLSSIKYCRDSNDPIIRRFIREVMNAGLGFSKAIKVLAIHTMLSTDVYPKPKNVVKEVSRACGLDEGEVRKLILKFKTLTKQLSTT